MAICKRAFNNMGKKANGKITYISFVLSILVVSIHTYNLSTYGFTGATGSERALIWFESRLNSFESVCVPFFFFLSGYLLFRRFEFSKEGIFKKYKSRFFSLFVPYVIWNTFYFVIYAVLTHVRIFKTFMNHETVELSLRNFLFTVWNSTFSPLWFVQSLMIMILPFPLYYILFRINMHKYTWILGPISFIVVFVMSTGWIPYKIPYIQPTFILGTFLAINVKDIFEKENIIASIAALAAFLTAVIWLCLNKPHGVIWQIVIIMSVWYLFDIIRSVEKEPRSWMKYSFFIYCAHDLILEAMEKIWLIIAGKRVWAAAVDYIFAPAVTVCILVFVANLLKKIMPGTWKIINGNRG